MRITGAGPHGPRLFVCVNQDRAISSVRGQIMAKQHRVCPWWLGRLLASPLRRLLQDPDQILAPYIRPGMTVLEPGPGMGFFTLPIARMIGEEGCVYALDVQSRMLDGLQRRAKKAGLAQ